MTDRGDRMCKTQTEGRTTAEVATGGATDRTTGGAVHPTAGRDPPAGLAGEVALLTAGPAPARVVFPKGQVAAILRGGAGRALRPAETPAPALTPDLRSDPRNQNEVLPPGRMNGAGLRGLPEAVPRGVARSAAVTGAPTRGAAPRAAAEMGAAATLR